MKSSSACKWYTSNADVVNLDNGALKPVNDGDAVTISRRKWALARDAGFLWPAHRPGLSAS